MSETALVPRTTVFLLAENRLLREALVRILAKKNEITVVGAIGFGPDAVHQLLSSKPEVVLFDSPSLAFHGPHLAATIRRALPETRVVMIGMERDEETFFLAIRESVVGYVLKDASAAEIVNVVRAVAAGEAVCPPCFSHSILQCAAKHLSTLAATPLQSNGLSRREQQLVGLVQLGLTNKEIATRLNLSERTIKNHVHRIFVKTGARDRMEMVELFQTNPKATFPSP
jgi:DNA-binding NarL/FixJ family response regulator